LTLRARLLLSQVPLVLAVLALGGVAVQTLRSLGSESQHILQDNYRSVLAAQRHLLENIEKAKEMGAEVVRLKGRDPVEALLVFARSHNVAYILLGRSHRPRWRRMVGDFVNRMVEEAEGFDLYIVSTEEEEDREP